MSFSQLPAVKKTSFHFRPSYFVKALDGLRKNKDFNDISMDISQDNIKGI
jgi:hypothetical protein